MTNEDIVNKLIGPINPVGETNTDDERYDNLKSLCLLTDQLLFQISKVAKINESASEFSKQRAAKFANDFIKSVCDAKTI